MSTKEQKSALLEGDVRSDKYLANNDNTNNDNINKQYDDTKDRFNLVYVICMLLGAGNLLAYNFLLSGADYYFTKYGDSRATNIMFWIIPMYTITDVSFLIWSLIFGDRFSFTSRIVFCFLLIGVCMFFPIFTEDIFFVVVGDNFLVAFWILMAVSLITGATTATLQPPILGFCNYLPVEYIRISVAGQAIAGIFASVIRILVNLLPVDINKNALIYFGICGGMLLIIGLSFLYTVRSAFVKFHLKDYWMVIKH